MNSVSYRFKNLNRYDNIILDSYSISFNGIEIENVTNENSLLQLISRGEINLTRDNEFFDNLAESILINSYVHASSFGIMQWDGNYNKFEIEVIINIDVISDY